MKQILSFSVAFAGLLLAGCSGNNKGTIEASGTLEAVEVNVSSKVPGEIMSLRVTEGSQVKTGDTIAVIDHSTLELQWKQAQAGVDLAEAQYMLLKNGARSEDLRQAEEALHQVESSLKSAKEDWQRMKQLLETQSITQKQFDDAESRYTIAQAQFNSANQNLQKVQRFARPEDLAAAKARVAQAQAAADLLKKQIRDAFVVAPVAGTVTHKPVEQGELLGSGATVVTISQLGTLNLMIYVSDTELGKVKLGSSSSVIIDTYPDRTFPGKVIYISPIAEFTPKNVQTKEDRTKLVFGVKIEVGNSEGILKAGMPADAIVK
ncbi:MAG: efflux RND transporter periplasmic adaptor subunit [Ignavibacteriales bacterium]|nr:efflux RND transporter periplasmic adaptor subunit [Ignavibacteriales bacterium]